MTLATHSLTLVAKNLPQIPVGYIAPLKVEALIALVQEGKRSNLCLQALREVNESKHWILCQCKGDQVLTEMPAMTVVRTKEGTLYLRNLASRPLHSNECPFSYDPTTFSEVKDRALLLEKQREAALSEMDACDSKTIPGTSLKNPLDLHLVTADRIGKTSGSTNIRSRSLSVTRKPEYPALGQVLLYLMERAGHLNQAAHFDFLQSLKDISKTAEQIQAFGDVSLSDVLAFSPKSLPALKRKVQTYREQGHSNAYGLAIMIIHEIHPLGEGLVKLWREPSDEPEWSCIPTGEVKIRSRRSITKGPFLAAITFAPTGDDFEPRAKHAFVLPVLSRRRLLPVESDIERRAAMSLVRLMEWCKEKKNFRLRIEKPMYEIETVAGYCRPDFVIHGLGNKVIVEVMGMMADADYRQRKERTVSIMDSYAPVIKLAPTKSTNDVQMQEALKEMNRSVLSTLSKHQQAR